MKYIGKNEKSKSRIADLFTFLRDLDDDLTGLSGAEIETRKYSNKYNSVSKTHETNDIKFELFAFIFEFNYGDIKRADQSERI